MGIRLDHVDLRFNGMNERFDKMDEQIQSNGIMIEEVKHNTTVIVENTRDLAPRVAHIETYLGIR